jgi:hypothetical protein
VAPAGAGAPTLDIPGWQRAAAAVILGAGLGLMVSSVALTRPHTLVHQVDVMAQVDTLYMAGFVLVLATLLALPWAVIRSSSARTAE